MIKIYGTSDDLVEIEGHPSGDEVGCYDQDVCIMVGSMESGGVAVRMHYGSRVAALHKEAASGCWSAEITPLHEDKPIPWPIQITTEGYSAAVLIDAPAGVDLRWIVVDALG